MTTIIYRYFITGITLAMLLISCSSTPTLQEYMLESESKNEFITTSIPKSILSVDVTTMSESDRFTYESVDKVHVLWLPKQNVSNDFFAAEKNELEGIFNEASFKSLVTHKQDGMTARVYYDGDDIEDIDEFIVYGSIDQTGLGVARILGNDMNMGAILEMLKNLDTYDVDETQIKSILKNFNIDK